MKGLNGFLLLGVPALLVLIGAVVFRTHEANDLHGAAISSAVSPESVRPGSARSVVDCGKPASLNGHNRELCSLISGSALRSRTLAANQRCYGGVVVQVDGTTYTQLGSVGDPVRCSGRSADRPIR